MFRLQMVKLIIQATRHLFFNKLSPLFTDQKIEPIIDKLDQSFFQFFVDERGDDLQKVELDYLEAQSKALYADLLRPTEDEEEKSKGGILAR